MKVIAPLLSDFRTFLKAEHPSSLRAVGLECGWDNEHGHPK